MIRTLGFAAAALVASPASAQQLVPSAFYTACLGSGGTPGVLTGSTPSFQLLSAQTAAFSLILAPARGIDTVQFRVEGGNGSHDVTMTPGQGVILTLYRLVLTRVVGRSNAEVDYCLRRV